MAVITIPAEQLLPGDVALICGRPELIDHLEPGTDPRWRLNVYTVSDIDDPFLMNPGDLVKVERPEEKPSPAARAAGMQIGPRIPVVATQDGATHERRINGQLYRFSGYASDGLRVVSAVRWDAASGTWLPAHLFHSYEPPAGLHAQCERVRCDDCRQDFDECDARYYEDQDARLCGDCATGRTTGAEDYSNWLAYTYR